SPSSSGDDKQGSACIQGHGECRLLPQDLALLLLGAVAVDTTACDPLLYKKRWTDPDEVALKSLWGRCERTLISSRGVCTPQDLVEKFGRIKYNVQQQLSLGVKALLISDYKEFDYPTAIITTTATAPSSSSSAAAVELVKVGVPALTVPLSILLSCDDEVSHDVLNSSFSSSSSSLSLPSDLLSQYIQSAKCLIQENHLDFLISVSNYRPPSSLSSSSGLSRQLAMMSLSRYDCVLQDLSEFLSSQEELHSTDDRELRVKKIEISGHPKNTHTTDRLSSGKEDPSESEEGDREEPPVAHCIYFFPHISPSYSRKLLEPILRQFFYSSSSSSPWRTQDISS
ncbi:dhh family protein, partial [Cystoisospora suis]